MVNFIKQEALFFISLFLMITFSVCYPFDIKNYLSYIDFPTIRALVGLLLITTALKQSNIFEKIVIFILQKIQTERGLAFLLVFCSLFLSMIITNDISLFVVVPLTMAFDKFMRNDVGKIIIFEAIAVNVGSGLMPIGNPQNIFLFRNWGISFVGFIENLSVLFFIQTIILFVFVFFVFPNKPINIAKITNKNTVNKQLLISSIVLFVGFIVAMELHFVKYFLFLTISWYLFFYKKVFREFDYFLIFTFILMFIDFRILANLEVVKNYMNSFDLSNHQTIFNLSIIISQIISNVPATIFMSEFSKDYQALAYGVNLAGNGLLIGSMANIIALRFYPNSKIYIQFHKYSILFFVLSYLFLYGLWRY